MNLIDPGGLDAIPILKGYSMTLNNEQIKHLVDRFLCAPIPTTVSPDGGFSYSHIPGHQPVGTNILSATEAEQVIRFMVEGMPGRDGFVYRDASTGEFVTEEYAAAHPDTTIRQTV